MGIKSLTGIFYRMRLSDPFRYKIPLLIAVPYLFLAIHHIPFFTAFKLVVAAIVTCIGFAGFGYATNDWSDIEKDKLAGKANAFEGTSFALRLAVTLFFVLLACLPWIYLPFTYISGILIALELLLFVLYAFLPFRLKEKGFWGVLTDALYAQALPVYFAAYTFNLAGKVLSEEIILLMATLTIWQFISGIRNIMLHQLEDFENDIKSGNKTFVIRFGQQKSLLLLKRLLIPAEIFLLGLFLFASVWLAGNSLGIIYVVLYAVLIFINRKGLQQLTYRSFCYLLLDDFYLECLPVCIIGTLVVYDYRFLVLLLLHIAIFRKNIFTRFA